MKAVICTRYGPPEVLRIEEVAKPTPRDNEVLIRIHATTVTSQDCRVRSFTVPPMFWIPGRLALGITRPRIAILGAELAGEIEAVGQAVTRFKTGDPVVAFAGHSTPNSFGAYAEYKCLPEDGMIAPKSAHLTYEQAAGIPFGGLTALNFLRAGHIQRGQSVLIYGASGAVGTYAVQLASYFGAEVTGVCSTANLELVTSLGADHVIDYTHEDFTQNGQTYDIIFDTVGKTTFSQCNRSLKPDGCYLHAVMVMAGVRARWYAFTTGKRVVGGTPAMPPDAFEFLIERIEARDIRPVVDRCYPLAQIVEAHRYVEQGHKKGNVVITVAVD